MNILSINKFFWRKGGSETVFFSEKDMLEAEGHSVIPFSMQGEKNELSPYSDFFVDEVDYSKPGIKNRLVTASKIIYSFDAKEKIQKLLHHVKPDLAHFHIFQHQISPSIFGVLQKRNIPIILTLHDLKPICPSYKNYVNGKVCNACNGGKFYNCAIKKCTKNSRLGSLINTVEMYFHYAMGYYQSVDRYIAVSKFYKEKMIEAGFPESKIDYLPNYIEASEFEPNSEDKGYMLYLGRLSEEKGLHTYLDAASINPEIPHLIAGTGPLEQALKSQVVERGLTNVKLLGFKQGKELKTTLSESTCVIVPSEGYENCPMTILEAFAAGRPVIGSRIGGIPELIDENDDGFTFDPGSSTQLSEKIRWIWNNRSQARRLGLAGRKKIELKFNAETHYNGLVSIYNSVIKLAS